jgi:hypothetical protein
MVQFNGRWRGRVVAKNPGFLQRVKITGATSGSGNHPGDVGTTFEVDGPAWQADLQWNTGGGSGWRASAVVKTVALTSPLVVVHILRADDHFPQKRDGDYDDLEVWFESLDPLFSVVQRPFSLDRGTLTMLPDGIFEASQGVQYMGVRIRNTCFFDWVGEATGVAGGVKIGIAPDSRIALASQGITVLDGWSTLEQRALGQVMDGGYVRVDPLPVDAETLIYFKADFSGAGPGKPEVGFVAQREAYDPSFSAPSRIVRKKIFVSRSAYSHANTEVVTVIPEGRLRLRLKSAIIDRAAATKAALAVRECLRKHPSGSTGPKGQRSGRDVTDELRAFLEAILACEDVDPRKLKDILDLCGCKPCDDAGGGGYAGGDGFPGGGLGDGSGADDWCRLPPVAWLPIEFEYRIEPNPAFAGQLGPLAFEDPWWKVALIILAALLEIGSLIADYVLAAEDSRFQIGKVVKKGGLANNVDCALGDLDGTRTVSLGHLDAQGDDVNNDNPISGLDSILTLDRSDNGDFGIQDAVLGSVVWKSGSTSATTRGVVTDIAFTTTINYDEFDSEFVGGDVTYTNQVVVGQIESAEQPLSQAGDSGSVWVDLTTARPVALDFAGPIDDSGTFAIGNAIREVVNVLDIRFNT